MTEQSKMAYPASFNIFRVIVNAAWYVGWLGLFIVILYLLFNVISEEKFVVIGGVDEVRMWLQYKPNSELTPFINRETDDVIFWGHKSVLVKYNTKSAWITKTVYQGIWFGALLWIAYNLKKLIRSIKIRGLFKNEMAIRIKRIGIFFILLGIFRTIIQGIIHSDLTYEINNRLNESVIQTPVGIEIDLRWDIMLIGLAIIVVSYIFQMGSQLQEEQDLTI